MNYRHGFHAGNFADLAKHAAVLALLRRLRLDPEPILVVDSHAGAGFYDLSNPDFARSKEAEAGIRYLLSAEVPQSLKPLADYVRTRNRKAGFPDRIGVYPGSPVLVLDHQRAGDGFVGCELREDDFRLLRDRVNPRGIATQEDGYAVAVEAANDERRMFCLIDPPFERPDDYARIVETLHGVLEVKPSAHALVWLPLKDLETFDAFLRHLEREVPGAEVLVSELRLRPLTNPMKMNGCALVAVNAPEEFVDELGAIAADVVAVFGDAGGVAKTYLL